MPTTDFLSKCFQGGRRCFKTEPDLRWEHIPGVWNQVPHSEGACDHYHKDMESDQLFTGRACRAGVQGEGMLPGGFWGCGLMPRSTVEYKKIKKIKSCTLSL